MVFGVEVLRLLHFNDMLVLSNGFKQSGSFCYENAKIINKMIAVVIMIGLNTYTDT